MGYAINIMNKQFVEVIAKFNLYGEVRPQLINVHGYKLVIEKVLDVRHNIKLLDGYCDRYTVLINHKCRYLYYNAPFWFLIPDFRLRLIHQNIKLIK